MAKKPFTHALKLLVLLLLPFLLLEFGLRLLGIGGSIVYVEDPVCGYRARPSQEFRTLGPRVTIDERGFRGPVRSSTLLCIGDSITYGCAFVGDAEAFPARLGAVNAGVNGWGMENMARFVQQADLRGYTTVLLTLCTADVFRPFTTLRAGLISTNRPMPLRLEYLFRYLWYGVLRMGSKMPPVDRPETFRKNLAAFEQIREHLQKNGIRLYVAFLAGREEAQGRPEKDLTDRDRMLAEIRKSGTECALFTPPPELDIPSLYRDSAHLTPKGNAWFTEELRKRFALP